MYVNRAFQVKMLLIVAAGVNALFFISGLPKCRKVDKDPVAPMSCTSRGSDFPFCSGSASLQWGDGSRTFKQSLE